MIKNGLNFKYTRAVAPEINFEIRGQRDVACYLYKCLNILYITGLCASVTFVGNCGCCVRVIECDVNLCMLAFARVLPCVCTSACVSDEKL